MPFLARTSPSSEGDSPRAKKRQKTVTSASRRSPSRVQAPGSGRDRGVLERWPIRMPTARVKARSRRPFGGRVPSGCLAHRVVRAPPFGACSQEDFARDRCQGRFPQCSAERRIGRRFHDATVGVETACQGGGCREEPFVGMLSGPGARPFAIGTARDSTGDLQWDWPRIGVSDQPLIAGSPLRRAGRRRRGRAGPRGWRQSGRRSVQSPRGSTRAHPPAPPWRRPELAAP